MLGYQYENGTLIVEPTEAEIVSRIFTEYLDGFGMTAIAKRLNADSIPTRFGNTWGKTSVAAVLQNYAYTGNLLLQKYRRVDHLTKRDEPNNGALPQYHVQGCHEAIIPLRSFNAVQEEMKRRAAKHTHPGVKQKDYPFSGKVTCAGCGKHYRRKVKETGPVWICTTYNTHLRFYSYEDLQLQMKRYLRRSNRIPMAVLGWKSPVQKLQELESARFC